MESCHQKSRQRCEQLKAEERDYGDCELAQDANNNDGRHDSQNLMGLMGRASCHNDKVQVFRDLRRHSEEGLLIDNSCEDWQMLEVDDPQFECAVKSDNSSICNRKNKNNNNNMSQASDLGAKKSEKYIEISSQMVASQDDGYTSMLIYLCTAIYSLLPIASVGVTFALAALLFTKFYYIPLLYVAYIFWDRKTCNRGGRRVDFIYRSKYWSYLAAYFPIKLRHSVDFKLDPSENYILNYSPHGISAFGAVTAFATDGLNFSKLFPGITARFMVHETSFVVPVMKEVFASRGDCSVNSKSIDYMLSSKERTGKAGNLLTIVVGGLAEADLSNSEVLKIVVAERKGFVKKALIHGANIIPCIAFGENSVFTKVDLKPGSFLHRLESSWYNLFKFKHPMYYGRCIFSESFRGVMPYKRPITVVMGDPISVERVKNPTQEDIDSLHARYLTNLRAMYEANGDLRVKYDTKLELV